MALWSAGRALLATGFRAGQGGVNAVGADCVVAPLCRALSGSSYDLSSKSVNDTRADHPGPANDDKKPAAVHTSANQAMLHAALERRRAENLSNKDDSVVREFSRFVTEAAPFLGCTTSGLEDSHAVRYPPVEGTKQLFPESRDSPDAEWLTFEHFPDSLESRLLDMYRRHNITMPCKEQQRIYGTVVAVSGSRVFVDTGDSTVQAFQSKELNIEDLVASKVPIQERRGGHDVRVGDVFVFTIEAERSPFGSMWLNPRGSDRESRKALVWEEIRRAYFQNQPINGRILNAVNRGFAVGVGGFVGFLPFSFAPPHVAARVGVLQRFYVFSLKEEGDRKDFMLRDPISWRQSKRPVKGASPQRSGDPRAPQRG